MLACASCGAELQIEDGHELCPKCLGVGHFREALSDPCIICSILLLLVIEERLCQVEGLLFKALVAPPSPPRVVSWGGMRK